MGIFGRRRAAASQPDQPLDSEQMWRERGFRFATDDEALGTAANATADRVIAAVDRGDVAAVEAEFTAAFTSRERMAAGARLYSSVLYWAHPRVGGPLGIRGALEPFRQRAIEHPTSLSRGLYTLGLIEAAWHVRGDGYRAEVADDRYLHYELLLIEAETALGEGGDDYVWSYAHYLLALYLHADDAVFADRFARVWAFDDLNPYLIGRHGAFLLPRWRGSDGATLEHFARDVAGRTQATWALGGYALAYYEATTKRDVELADFPLDKPRLLQACADLVRLYPSAKTRSMELLIAYNLDDNDRARALLDGGLRVIDQTVWTQHGLMTVYDWLEKNA